MWDETDDLVGTEVFIYFYDYDGEPAKITAVHEESCAIRAVTEDGMTYQGEHWTLL